MQSQAQSLMNKRVLCKQIAHCKVKRILTNDGILHG